MDVQQQKIFREVRLATGLPILEVPRALSDQIVPVIEVSPRLLQRSDIVRGSAVTTSGTITFFTTPTNIDFYLTSLLISYQKDATCDIASGIMDVSVTINGTGRVIASVSVLTLTAGSGYIPILLPKGGIKLDRATGVNFSGTFTVGALVRAINLTGYEQSDVESI